MKSKLYKYFTTIAIMTIIILMLSNFSIRLKSNILFLISITSIIYISIVKHNIGYGLITYLFWLVICYIINCSTVYWHIFCFLGIYPFIKFFIEFSLGTFKRIFIFKYLWFNSTLMLLAVFYKSNISINIVSFFLFVFFQFLFYFYDIILTDLIKFMGRYIDG